MLTDTATLPSQKEKEGKDSGVGHDSDRLNESSDQVNILDCFGNEEKLSSKWPSKSTSKLA